MLTNENRYKKKRVKIDWEMIDRYCEAGCTGLEIAALLGIHRMTLYTRCKSDKGINFEQYRHSKRSKGDAYIRAAQYKQALQGDRKMLIWLGKNRLGQKDCHTWQESFNGQLAILLDKLKNIPSSNSFASAEAEEQDEMDQFE